MKVNGVPTDAQFAEQVPLVNQVLFGLKIGEPASFIVMRAASELTVKVTPIERPAALSTPRELRVWGVVASNLTAFEARALGRDGTDGVRIVSLRAGGPMEQARPALGRDDVIVEVEGKKVASVADLEALGSSNTGPQAASHVRSRPRTASHRCRAVWHAGAGSARRPRPARRGCRSPSRC